MKRSELKEMIREEIRILKESADKYVYAEKNRNYIVLWSAYAVGSGTTLPIKKLNTFYTDKQSDSHYDSIVERIANWSKSVTPAIKGVAGNVYKIPFYDTTLYPKTNQLSIYGGDINPQGYLWLAITSFGENIKYNIINLFKNKKEATYWIKNK